MSRARTATCGTSLITMYIDPLSHLRLVVGRLVREQSIVHSIKNRIVRKDVLEALKAALYQLRNYEDRIAPGNGLILCACSTEDRCRV